MNPLVAVGLVSVVLIPMLLASRGRNALDREWVEPGRPEASAVAAVSPAATALAAWPELGELGDLSDLVGVLAPSDLLWLRDLLDADAEGRR